MRKPVHGPGDKTPKEAIVEMNAGLNHALLEANDSVNGDVLHCSCISSTTSLATSALNSSFPSTNNRRALLVGGGRYRRSPSTSARTSWSSVRNHLSFFFECQNEHQTLVGQGLLRLDDESRRVSGRSWSLSPGEDDMEEFTQRRFIGVQRAPLSYPY